jgi:ATP-binding cassette subfamily B protein
MSFYAILGYFTTPVSRLINANKEIQNALIAADRLFEIMDLEQEKSEQTVEMFKEPTGDIQFADVSFRYGTRVELFDKFNLVIPCEKITAIIGQSGSGKSTLVNLLQKIYPIQKGKICIGETDIRYVASSSLRDHIAVVPQEIHLFSGTVLDNIALGDMAPEMERILQLCSTLGLLEFIEALPQGFHTHLGENGALLSGGQKQRIAIARALYKDPRILILDEATASLDSRSEHFIHKAIEQLKTRHKTVIQIAHRLSTVIHADKIVVLQNGKVAEEGTHEQLFCQKGVYFDQWQRQLPSVPLVREGDPN